MHEYKADVPRFNVKTLINFAPEKSDNVIVDTPDEQAMRLAVKLLHNVWDLHLSIDLETPVKGGQGIFSVGIVPFSQETGTIYHELAFYARFNFNEVLEKSGFDPATIRWWLMQEKAAIMEIIHTEVTEHTNGRTSEKPLPHFGYVQGMCEALTYIKALKNACRVDVKVLPLGNGKEFDVIIFQNTLRHLGLIPKDWRGEEALPWEFWDAKDLRERLSDVLLLSGVNLKKTVVREGTHHNAVDDALHQARLYLEGYSIIMDARKAYKGN